MSAQLTDRGPTRRSGRPRAQDPVEDVEDPVGGATRGWSTHQLTAARAQELGIDLVRWPLDEPAAGWQQRASCRGASAELADELSEVLSQSAATPLVNGLCSWPGHRSGAAGNAPSRAG